MKGFEQLSWFYDAVVIPLNRFRLGAWRQQLVADLQGDVLEIGVGTGLNLEFYSSGAKVTALDPNRTSLQAARKRATQAGARLQLADAQALPFVDHSFDAVVSTLVFCSIPKPTTALAEIRRVLRPGGRLIQMEHTRTGRRWPDLALSVLAPAWYVISGGCHITRDTDALLVRQGWRLLRHEQHAGGLVRLLVSTPA